MSDHDFLFTLRVPENGQLDAMLSEEPPRNLQDALAMLSCIAPFMPPVGLE